MFVQQIFIVHRLCARPYFGFRGEQNTKPLVGTGILEERGDRPETK